MNQAGTLNAAASGTTLPPAVGSSISVPTYDGPNALSIDISNTWVGTVAVWHVVNGKVRVVPMSSLTNEQTSDTSGISSGSTGRWIFSLVGGGTCYFVMTAYSSGQIDAQLSCDRGSANAGVSSVQGAIGGIPQAVGAYLANPSANFNRPANTTAYASTQLVANNTSAGAVVPMSISAPRISGGAIMLRRIKLKKSGTSLTNASFRVHFYTASPTVSNGDGGAWLTDNSATYCGAFDVTLDKAFTDGAVGTGVPINGFEINIVPSGSNIYALIEARGAYTPVSAETFTLFLEDFQLA